jgi:hypothetical protein
LHTDRIEFLGWVKVSTADLDRYASSLSKIISLLIHGVRLC